MFAEQICAALNDQGYSINGMARAAGIQQASLQRFCTNQGGLRLAAAEELCEKLGLRLVKVMGPQDLADYCKEEWVDSGKDLWREGVSDTFRDHWEDVKRDFDREYEDEKARDWKDHLFELDEYLSDDEADQEYETWLAAYDEENYEKQLDECHERFSDEFDEENTEADAYAAFVQEKESMLQESSWALLTE